MKNIALYNSPKYASGQYEIVADGIFRQNDRFFVSLSFKQEPAYEEGISPKSISQYPLEDILDKFSVYVSDFYPTENEKSKSTCYLEFAGKSVKNVTSLCSIVGKHVYNKEVSTGSETTIVLVIE